MTADVIVTGLFKEEGQAAAAIEAVKSASWSLVDVYSPIPSDRLAAALNRPASRLGYFTLVGAIIGFFSGFLLAAFTSSQWKLIVSGKPVFAWVPFFIVGFEFTILFGVLANVVGLIYLGRLPDKAPAHYYAPAAGDHYMISVACREEERSRLADLLAQQGADIAPVSAEDAGP